MFFPLYTEVAPPIYVSTTSFKLMTLRNIMVEEALLSRSVSVTLKQTSHPVSSKKVKSLKVQLCTVRSCPPARLVFIQYETER